MRKHRNPAPLLLLLLLAVAAAFVLLGMHFAWFTTEDTVVPPTCTEEGYTLHRGYFGVTSTVDPTPAAGHRYLREVTEPTCLVGGFTAFRCEDCGHSYDGDFTEPRGHHYTSVTTPATCTESGFTTHTCHDCKHVYHDGETPPTGHRYLATVTPATCTAGGYTTNTCAACSDSYRSDETEAAGHQNQIITLAPTCTEPGFTLTQCAVCAAAELTDPKQALGHSYLSYVTPATCTTDGQTTHICERCHDSYIDERIQARGHQYTSRFSPATTDTLGGTFHTCTRCADTYLTDAFSFADVFDGRQGDGNGIMYEGVDLSHHNGEVDFVALRQSGISFVILRVGTSRTLDTMFETYYKQARAAGLNVGAYIYTYADSPAAAREDAAWVLEKLKGKTFEYPIFFDIEDPSLQSLSASTLTEITLTFCEEMVDAGYYPGVYTNKRWMAEHLEIDRIRAYYDIWLASWIVTGENIFDYSDDFGMWQYTATGQVSGVSTDVDRNGAYRDYPTYIRTYGYNGLK